MALIFSQALKQGELRAVEVGFMGTSMGDPQESPLGFLSKLLRNLWMTSVANLEIMISCWENEMNIELQCFAYVNGLV